MFLWAFRSGYALAPQNAARFSADIRPRSKPTLHFRQRSPRRLRAGRPGPAAPSASSRAHHRQSASPGFVARRRGLRHAAARPCHARALPRLTRAGDVRPAPPVRPSLVAAPRLCRIARCRAWSSPVHNRLLASESSLCGQAAIRSCRSRING